MIKFDFYLKYDCSNGNIINTKTCEVVCENYDISVLSLSDSLKTKLIQNSINKLSKLISLNEVYLEFYGLNEEEIEYLYGFVTSLFEPVIVENNEIIEEKICKRNDFFTLSVRARNVLKANNIDTIEKLSKLSFEDLKGFKNSGVKTAQELVDYVRINGRLDFVEKEDPIDKYISSLSVRARNVLRVYNINTIEKLSRLNIDELKSFNHAGKKTINELIEIIKLINMENDFENKTDFTYLINKGYEIKDKIYFDNNLFIEDVDIHQLNLPFKTKEFLKRNNLLKLSDLLNEYYNFEKYHFFGKKKLNEVRKIIKEYVDNNLIDLSDKESAKNHFKKYISDIIFTNKFEGISSESLYSKLGRKYSISSFEENILELIQDKTIFLIKNRYYYNFPSIIDYINQQKDSKEKEIVIDRLNCLSLEEIGNIYNLTRERIRQIVSKYLKKINIKIDNKLIFKEDKYKYIFTTYDLSKREFAQIFGEKKETYGYLSIIHKHGKVNIKEALNDELIDIENKNKIEKYIYRKHYFLDGEYVPKSFLGLLKHYVKKYLKEQKRIDEIYYTFIDYVKNIDETIEIPNAHAFENYFERIDVINSINKLVRYYDYSKYDYSELLEELNIKSYMNYEISTKIFFKNKIGVLLKYDIKDKYELHNLLRRLYGDNHEYIKFERMPFICIGDCNIKNMLLEILEEYEDLSVKKFIDIIDERFGTDDYSAQWLQNINEYKRFGGYSWKKEILELTEEEITILKSLLKNDFYWKNDIINICKDKYPKFNIEKLSHNNYKKLGFTVNKFYVVKGPQTAYEYFNKKLLEKEIFNIAEYKEFTYLQIYSEAIINLKKEYKIIEFDNGLFVNIRRLELMNIKKEDILNLIDRVCEFNIKNNNGNYFSLNTLRKLGFDFMFDKKGFKDIFIESILKYSNKLCSTSYNNIMLFTTNNTPFSIKYFLKEIMDANHISDLELIEYLLKEFNIKTTESEIREYLKIDEQEKN